MNDDQRNDASDASQDVSDGSGTTGPVDNMRIAEVGGNKAPEHDTGLREFQEAWAPVASAEIAMEMAGLKADGADRPAGPPPPAGSNTAGKDEAQPSSE